MRRNINLIKRDLEFAADVMRRLPPIKMQQVRSSWPRLVYTADELEAQKPLPVYFHPTAQEIDKMYKILDWYKCLDAFETKLVWKRSCHVPWKIMQLKLRQHRSTLYAKYMQSLIKIQLYLDKSQSFAVD